MLNRNRLTLLSIVLISLLGGYFIWWVAPGQKPTPVQPEEILKTSSGQAINSTTQNDSAAGSKPRIGILQDPDTAGLKKSNYIDENRRTYINKRLGFTFQYPATWYQNGQDADVINLSGVKTEVDISFTDSVSKNSLLIAYHLAPEGTRLYEYIANQYHSSQGRFSAGGTLLQVAGKNAFESTTILTVDGKGHKMNPPLELVIVDLPDFTQTGAIELQFKTPAIKSETEVSQFHQVLSGFKFMSK